MNTRHLDEIYQLLRDSSQRYQELYDFLPVPLFTLDAAGIIREIGQGALDLLACERERFLGMPFVSLVATEDRTLFRKHLVRCRAAGVAAVTTELGLRLPANRLLPVQMVTRRAANPHVAYWTVLIDRSDRQRAEQDEERLREAEQAARAASDAKDLFISVLSHELRSPLTAVAAAAAALADGTLPSEQVRAIATSLKRSSDAQSRLIDDLLDVTRVLRHKLNVDRAPLDLHQVVREVCEILSGEVAAKGVTITLALDAAQARINGDAIRLRQVFWNLLHNAIKFTPAGGGVELRSWNKQGRIVVEVCDTGIGMRAEDLEHLFRPFEQVLPGARGGLGLGLAITKGIIDLHEGSLVAASPGPGKGTRFLVELATLESLHERLSPEVLPPRRRAQPPERRLLAQAGQRILLVEDNPDISALLGRVLLTAGYQVEVATSFQAALAKANGVDVVLSDLQLPDGSGIDLVRRLRQSQHDLTAIALSGYASPEDVHTSHDAGFAAHLKKPIDVPALLAAIEEATGAALRVRRQSVAPVHGPGNA